MVGAQLNPGTLYAPQMEAALACLEQLDATQGINDAEVAELVATRLGVRPEAVRDLVSEEASRERKAMAANIMQHADGHKKSLTEQAQRNADEVSRHFQAMGEKLDKILNQPTQIGSAPEQQTTRNSPSAPEGPLRFDVTVSELGVAHLPKMDMLGTCDPYVEVMILGMQKQTDVIKNCYQAAFPEKFTFTVKVAANEHAQLVLHVKDWDRGRTGEEVGFVVLPLDSTIVLGAQTRAFVQPLLKMSDQDRVAVRGKDGEPTILSFTLTFSGLLEDSWTVRTLNPEPTQEHESRNQNSQTRHPRTDDRHPRL